MIETIKLGRLKWYHVLDPSDENLQFLSDNFHFHPLDIEDCRSVNQRSKVDIYDDYYFIILHFPYLDKSGKFIRTREVKVFWGEDYIITIGKSHWVVKDLFNQAKEQYEKNEAFQIDTSDALLYTILERLMVESLVLLKRIGAVVELINRQLFDKRSQRTIELISITRKNIILLNTMFKPQLRLFQLFESGKIDGYAENMEDYWGNILDYYHKMWDMTEDYQELIEGLSKTFDSLQTNKTNEIMKLLTMISSILLPLTFITGLYGMNVGLPLDNDPRAFWVIIGVTIFIGGLMFLFFKKKDWL
ncbi:MAG: magnesium transporter CorA family protein [Bacteroidales bacterium]|nr:magnesium transporter CorA family protein [Bacteroidales bacterium]